MALLIQSPIKCWTRISCCRSEKQRSCDLASTSLSLRIRRLLTTLWKRQTNSPARASKLRLSTYAHCAHSTPTQFSSPCRKLIISWQLSRDGHKAVSFVSLLFLSTAFFNELCCHSQESARKFALASWSTKRSSISMLPCGEFVVLTRPCPTQRRSSKLLCHRRQTSSTLLTKCWALNKTFMLVTKRLLPLTKVSSSPFFI